MDEQEKNGFVRCMQKRKVQQTLEFTGLCGGDGGIRTHVPAHHRQNDFESFSLPLRYVSIINIVLANLIIIFYFWFKVKM